MPSTRTKTPTKSPTKSPPKSTSPKKERKKGENMLRWTTDEESKLKKLMKDKDAKKYSWTDVADKLGTGRSSQAVAQHWKLMTVLDRGETPKAKKAAKMTPAKKGKFMAVVGFSVLTAVVAYAAKVYFL